MSKSPSSSNGSGPAEAEKVHAPAQHSLLKKGGPDDLLLMAYKKVEKKLASSLKAQLSDTIGCEVILEVGDSEKLLFDDWLSDQEAASVYLEFQLGVLETPLWVRISRTFVTAAMDCFFGGEFDGQIEADGELKKSEIAMIDRLAAAMENGLTEAWSALGEMTIRYSGHFSDKDDVESNLADGSVLIAATSAELSGHKIAAIDIVQTLDGLIAIEPQLNRSEHRATNEIDPVWRDALTNSAEQIYLPVRSVLGRPTMQLSELSRLAVGDILPVAGTDNVPLIVGDRVFAHGIVGEQNGGVAFKIKHFS
ncbi:FliM/FliN family flagellar motor switch protein [Parasphingorhabdus sp.]|uniref:FliM/FliN family flagellar motor switch protein n=1 Tax=Parasphingorhabdus sp. TaxID=2709688 RepID=UPI003D2BDC21